MAAKIFSVGTQLQPTSRSISSLGGSAIMKYGANMDIGSKVALNTATRLLRTGQVGGTGRQRIKQVYRTYSSEPTETTKNYVGGNFEKTTSQGLTKWIHYIHSPQGLVAILTRNQNGQDVLNYVLNDHLGSVQVLANEQGGKLEEYSYDAWGLRRDPVTLQVYVPDPETDVEYGFTGHEHLDAFKMINMSGRMYDPVLGRFLSPDPFLQFPDFTQGLNPYSYALNNPLRFVDPDGYSLFGTILAITFQILVTPINPMLGILAFSVIMTIDYAIENGRGVNISDLAQYFAQTFAMSAASMGTTKAIGSMFDQMKNTLMREVGRAAAHGLFNGGMRMIQGGKFEHGFLSGFVSSLGGSAMIKYGGNMDIGSKVALSAALGGTAEVLGGGKFANGAVTGAYVMMFNHLQDVIKERNDPWADFEAIDYSEMNDSERAIQILKAWKYSNENGLGGEIPLDRIFTNLKCSNTLKNGGIVINEAGIQFGDKVVEVTIRVPLFNSTKHSQFLGTNVQFGGEGKVNPIGTDWYQLKNATEIIGIKGEDNYDFLLKWVGYE